MYSDLNGLLAVDDDNNDDNEDEPVMEGASVADNPSLRTIDEASTRGGIWMWSSASSSSLLLSFSAALL